MKKRFLFSVGLDTLLLLLTLLLFVSIRLAAQPVLGEVRYKAIDVEEWSPSTLPAEWDSPQEYTDVEVEMTLPTIHPVRFRFLPNDCLDALWVNEQKVENFQIPFCQHIEGRLITLRSSIHSGNNTIRMRIQNHGKSGGAHITVPWNDPVLLLLNALIAILSLLVLRSILRIKKSLIQKRRLSAFWSIVCMGIFLRVFYLLVTHYLTRGHDVSGHIEYMEYIAKYWSIPLTKDGWQFYQPPLYYIITGIWMFAGQLFGLGKTALIIGVQYFSFVIALLTFFLGVHLGNTLLFPKKNQVLERNLYAALLAILPSFVFFAGRINNDGLVVLWMLLSFIFLLKWWKHGQAMQWTFSILFLILGILTKSNSLLLLPAIGLCLILRKKTSPKHKLALGSIAVVLISALTGWHFYMRFGVEKNISVVANITHLNRSLVVDDSVKSISTFNPVRIVTQPFNNPFSDTARRDFFWEYLFRSAFFGEFQFGLFSTILSTIIVLCALLLSPLTWIGIWKNARERFFASAPMLLALFFPLLGHLLYRQSAPFSTSQDFRYSMFIIFPLFYFLLYGLNVLPRPLRKIALILLYIFIGSCTLFLLSLGFQ